MTAKEQFYQYLFTNFHMTEIQKMKVREIVNKIETESKIDSLNNIEALNLEYNSIIQY